ncbi:RodZ domain-containing protein [Marinobacter fonticola]|uniref:RodZ domain-containing protein n=1 Tax=Marinobacter fonticola TaxID=2603215 RepID=UPI0011E8873E|nr:RodZ domain-containing protein [Marinobacter fonticola]
MNNDDAQRQPEAPALAGEVGNQLRKAREAKGMSVTQVADSQHLRPSIIQAIEEGQYEKIGSELFLKGYVRTYAEQVGLDPAAVIEKLDWELEPMRQQVEDERKDNPLEDIERRKQRKRRIARWTMIILLLVALVLVGMRLLDRQLLPFDFGAMETADESVQEPESASNDLSTPEQEGDATATPVAEEGGNEGNGSDQESLSEEATEEVPASPEPEAPAEPEQSVPAEQQDEPVVDTAPQQPEPAQQEQPAEQEQSGPQEPTSVSDPAEPEQEPLVSSPAPTDEAQEGAETDEPPADAASADQPAVTAEATQPAADTDVLSGNFTGDCWVSVENGQGQTVIASLKRAGDSLQYEGQGPFRIVLGAADAATLSFNGEAVDLSRYPAPNNRVALTLGN